MFSRSTVGFPRLAGVALAIIAAAAVATPQATRADTLHATDDAYVDLAAANQTTKFGKNPDLIVSSGGAGKQVFLRFDLSTLPAGATVDQAQLRLYVDALNLNGSLDVHLADGAWNERKVNGGNAPLPGTLVQTVILKGSNKRRFVTVDVTAEVQDWLDGVVPNHGLALVPAAGGVKVTFDSKENKDTSHGPELEVTLAGAPDTSAATACDTGQVLDGDGACINVSSITPDTDTNAATICGPGQLLLGDGTCQADQDTLGGLSCSGGQGPQWNGSTWQCADSPVAGLTNLRLVTLNTTVPAGTRASLLVECNSGETVVSGGWFGQNISIEGNRPGFFFGPPGWIADFFNEKVADISVNVWAICGTP